MSGETITINGPDGSFSGYLAKPASGKGPGIVVIQEIFGVNQVMRDIADGLAAQGYVALCPDLFWRIEPGIDITDKTEAEWKRAFELFGLFNTETGLTDIKATIDTLRPLTTGKVGAVGYCLGGFMAYLTACKTDADASVGFYGVNIQTRLADAEFMTKPLMLHIAGKDEFVNPGAQAEIIDDLRDNALVTIHQYPECDHAFARVGGQHYDKKAADEANARTLAFFKKNLA
ncbi:MAG: dienelactone hydrolase family protein [Parvibaculum sp.]|uniref:dienelactone hydrolase family protein n=1 Tax=Parvibaculum sp. TaxID=2024848 RepID=UPI003C72B2FC